MHVHRSMIPYTAQDPRVSERIKESGVLQSGWTYHSTRFAGNAIPVGTNLESMRSA